MSKKELLRIAAHEAALEQARVPKFGDRVEYENDRGWKIAMDVATPEGWWAIIKEGHARMAWATRSEFRILDPNT